MTDSAWPGVVKALGTFLLRLVPQRILAWWWPPKRVLEHVDVFASGTPRFYTEPPRISAALEQLVFNVHNLTPLALKVVGVDLEIKLNSTTLFRYEHRFATEATIAAYSRGGFHVQRELTDAQARAVRAQPDEWVLMRVYGWLYLRSAAGEYQRQVHADVVVLIDAENRAQRIRTTPPLSVPTGQS